MRADNDCERGRLQPAQQVDPAKTRHANVEQHQVDLARFQRSEGFRCIVTLPSHRNVVMRAEVMEPKKQPAALETRVPGDEHPFAVVSVFKHQMD